MFEVRATCLTLIIAGLSLSGCRVATSGSSEPFFPENLLIQSEFLEIGNVCYRGSTLEGTVDSNLDDQLKGLVLTFRDERIFLKEEQFFFENGRQSPVTLENAGDFKGDISYQPVGCGSLNLTEITKLDEYSYLIQPPSEFWKGFSISSNQTSEMEALGASQEEISQFLNDLRALSVGLPVDNSKGEPTFGLVLRFIEGGLAEGGIYSHATQSIVGKRILYAASEQTSDRGHHYLSLNGVSCSIADVALELPHSANFSGGIYSRKIKSCTIQNYEDFVTRTQAEIDKGNGFSGEHYSFSFLLLRPDPVLPTILALDFQELLDPDFSDEILRTDR